LNKRINKKVYPKQKLNRNDELSSVLGHLGDSELIVKPAELNNQAGFIFVQNDSS